MKLHLPKKLLAAVLSCVYAAALPLATTVGTGALVATAATYTAKAAEHTNVSGNIGYTSGDTYTLSGDTTFTGIPGDGDAATVNADSNNVTLRAEAANTKVPNFVRLSNVNNLSLLQGRYFIDETGDFNGVSGDINICGAQVWFYNSNYTGNNAITQNMTIEGGTFAENIASLDYAAMRIGANVMISGVLTIGESSTTSPAKISFEESKTLTLSGGISGTHTLLLGVYGGSNTLNITGSTTTFSGLLEFQNFRQGSLTVKAGSENGLHVGGIAGNNGALGLASGSTTAELTLDVAEGQSHSFAGTIANGYSIVKTGAGTQAFTNAANTLSGSISVEGGTLEYDGVLQNTNAITLTNNSTLTLGGTVTVTNLINNDAGTLILKDGVVLNKIIGSGKRFGYVDGYGQGEVDLSKFATNTNNVTKQGSITHGFSNVIFQNGSTLVIGNGQTVTTAPNIAAGASITLEVGAGNTGTWSAAAQPTGTGYVSTVNVGAGAALNVVRGGVEPVLGVFAKDADTTQEINLAANSTLTTSTSLAGWTDKKSATVVNMKSLSTWNITPERACEYMNKTTINMENATINIASGKSLHVERGGNGNNVINVYENSGTSSITGGGTIQLQNYRLDFGVVQGGSGAAENDPATKPTLSIAVAIVNGVDENGDPMSHGIQKSGDSVLELTNGGNTYSGGTTVNGGTLRLAGAGGKAGDRTGAITVAAGATLELAHTLDCETANTNINLNGNLLVSGSANETISGSITGRGNLTVNSGTLTLSGGSAVSLNRISVAQDAMMVIDATKTSQTGGVNVMETIHNYGTLTVSGAIIIGNADNLEVYEGAGNFSEGANGTYRGGGTVKVVQGTLSGTGSITIGSDVFYVGSIGNPAGSYENSENFTWYETGVLTYSSGVSSMTDTIYHVNTGTVIYGDNANGAASTDITGIELNGGDLTLNIELTDNAKHGADGTGGTGIVVQQAATVTIGERVTLAQADLTANAATQLDGSGTYALGETATSLGNNVSLAEGWTGFVNGLKGNMNLYDYCNSNSSVGYAENQTVGTINSEGGTIKGTTGLSIDTLNTRSGTLVFDGTTATVTGTFDMRGGGHNGNIELVNDSTLTSTIGNGIWGNGDVNSINEATSVIKVDSSSTFTEAFAETSTSHNFSIRGIAKGSDAEIVLEDGQHHVNDAVSIKNAAITSASTSNKTLSSQLTNSNVTHSGSGTLTISGDLSEGNGEMSVTGGGTMKISASSTANTASSTANNTFTLLSASGSGSTLELGGSHAYTTTKLSASGEGSSVTIKTGSTLQVDNTVDIQGGNLAISSGAILTVGSNTMPSAENASETTGGTITAGANREQGGTARNVTIDASGISGATSGEGESMQALGEMTSLTLEFTAAASISNVKLRDVTLSGGNLTLSGVKAIASTVAEPSQRTMALSAAADAGSADTQTLTATPVVQNATYKGDLTVDIDDAILSPANAGKDFKWFIFDNVTLAADGSFTLNLGKNLTDMLRNGQPTVTLSGGWVNDNGKSSVELTYDDLANLHTGEGGLLAGSVTTGGDLVLTVTNIPEPTTGTLSVLALAALAARRRRK